MNLELSGIGRGLSLCLSEVTKGNNKSLIGGEGGIVDPCLKVKPVTLRKLGRVTETLPGAFACKGRELFLMNMAEYQSLSLPSRHDVPNVTEQHRKFTKLDS
jgi:hypothetical protein